MGGADGSRDTISARDNMLLNRVREEDRRVGGYRESSCAGDNL